MRNRMERKLVLISEEKLSGSGKVIRKPKAWDSRDGDCATAKASLDTWPPNAIKDTGVNGTCMGRLLAGWLNKLAAGAGPTFKF